MTLTSGTRLGPYEIVARIGAGGMGEVFRARDTRLDRTVAVKMLPAELAGDAQLRMRLQREAKAISSLSHPNICALYDVGEQDGMHYLVMEHLEGESLADRLERGALPLREALRYGIEIAGALERAHRAGVVHRDLKPGNVMLTKAGAKLLDFGLAKHAGDEGAVSADAPTMHARRQPLTAEGTIIGTFQYMSPEQLESAPVDARTDLFAFGAVLYEMVTGQRAFAGKTRTSLIAAIVAASPRPMTELAPVTPPELEHVVARCLEKDPDARWQSAHDVRLELEYIVRQLDAPSRVPRRRSSALPWIVAALAAAIAIGAGTAALRGRQTTPQRLHAQILPPPGRELRPPVDTISISPDARYITFAMTNDPRLWLRSAAANDAKPLEGTEGGLLPFWSPDSRWIGFIADGKLKKVSVAGTPPVTLCDAPKGRPGAWNDDGVILFSPSSLSGLHRVSAEGGTPQPVTTLAKGETTHRWPVFLPDGEHFLYLAAAHDDPSVAGAIYVASLDNPAERTLVMHGNSHVAYARGHLLYTKRWQLLAQPFDAGARKLTGEPLPIAANVNSEPTYFRSSFAAAADGTILYQQRRNDEDAVLMRQEPPNAPVEVMRPKLAIADLRIAPDRRTAIARVPDPESGINDFWLLDLEQKSKVRLTATPAHSEWEAAWSPDSKRIAYTRSAAMVIEMMIKTIQGNAADRLLMRNTTHDMAYPSAWSPDGRYVLYHQFEGGKDHTGDVYAIELTPGAKPIPVAVTPAAECCGSFSPDGSWVIYRTLEGSRAEMFATRFPNGGTAPIPLDATFMAFGADNHVFAESEQGLEFRPVTTSGDRFTVGKALWTIPMPQNVVTLHAHGTMILYTTLEPDPYSRSLTVITDWMPAK